MFPGVKCLLLLQLVAILIGAKISQAIPANDAFTNAVLIGSPPSRVAGTTVGATTEPGEPNVWHGERTVWWYWVATKSGGVALKGVNNSAPVITIFRGNELTNLVQIALNTLPDHLPMVFQVEQGTAYYIRAFGAEEIEFNFEAVPENDAFASAFPIDGSFAQVFGDNTLATMEPGEAGQEGYLKATLWWKWIAPESGRFRIGTTGSEAPVEAWLLQGTLDSVQVLANSYSGTPADIVEGQTYYIRVASPLFGRGKFIVSLWPAAPVNDRFGNRIPLTGNSGRTVGSNIGATSEAGEKLFNLGSSLTRSTVWWSWTAPADGRLVLNCTNQPNSSLGLAIHAGTSLRNLSKLAFGHQRISAPVIKGRHYAIQISGSTDFAFDYVLMAAPTNDARSAAISLTGSFLRLTNDNLSATFENGERKISAEATGASLWYIWTAPKNGWCWLRVASLDPSSVASVPFASVYSGSPSSRPIASTKQDDNLSSKVGFAVSEGASYWVAVDTSGGRRGLIALELDLTTLRMEEPIADSIVSQGDPPIFSIPAVDTEVDGALQNIELILSEEYNPPLTIQTIASLPASFQPTNFPSGACRFFIRATNSDGRERISPPITILARPANDAFAHRAHASGYGWSTVARFEGATRELFEPLGGRPSLWYSWIAPANGMARISCESALRAQPNLAVFTGDTLQSLKRVRTKYETVQSEGLRAWEFPATEGETYQIAVTLSSINARRGFNVDVSGVLFNSSLAFPDGETFLEGANIPVSLLTSERLETIQKIDFFNREELIGTITGGTTFLWSNAPCGVHYILAQVQKTGNIQPPQIFGTLIRVRPRNDEFIHAEQIEAFPASVQSCTESATRETGEPLHRGMLMTGSVWWRFTAPTNGTLIVSRPGNYEPFPYGPYFALYNGSKLEELTLVATNGDPRLWGRDIVASLTAGFTYHLATSSSEQLRLRFFPRPANDNFAQSTEIIGTNTTVYGYTVQATAEPGEPFLSQNAGTNTVWWHWIAPTNGSILPRILGSPSSLWFGIYEGESVEHLSLVQPRDSARWVVQPGHIYHFAIASSTYEVAEELSLRLEFKSAAANDMFIDAIPISGESAVFNANTVGATTETGEPTLTNGIGTSLWWQWTAPRSGKMRILRTGSFGGGLVFEVFSGNSLPTLMPITFPHRLLHYQQFNAVAGQTYSIMVDSVLDIVGTGDLELSYEPFP